MANDIEKLRRDVSLAGTASSYGVKLEKDGYEYIACCPFHAEDTPSFTIFTGKDKVERFHCFGCGERGDVVDFVRGIKGVDLKEAIKILGGGQAGDNVAPRQIEARDIYAWIVPLPPAGEIEAGKKVTLYNPKRADDPDRAFGSFAPSMVFPYRRADGSLIGYVLRHELRDGGKETPMVMWARIPDGREGWCRYPFPKPRVLYGLDAIGDARQVVIVEGEKCRDKLRVATGRVVVSWPGGTYGIRHTDWKPLAGRNVVIWPDADKPGLETANEIAAILNGLGCTVRIVDVNGAPDDGWDCADWIDKSKWGKDQLDAYMRERVKPWKPDGNKPASKPAERRPDPAPTSAAPKTETRASEPRTAEREPVKQTISIPENKPVDKYPDDVPTGSQFKLKDHPFRDRILDLREWIFLSSDGMFYNTVTSEVMAKTAFDLAKSPVTPSVEIEDKEGNICAKKYPPSKTLIDFLGGTVVSTTMYRPDAGDMFFEVDGIKYVNSYLDRTVTKAADDWQDHDAWKIACGHIYNILPDVAPKLIQWLAHNVQFPGKKILWSPIIVGVQGDGKTTLATKILQAAMGAKNVKTVSPEAMFSDFTGWAEGACVRVLEEIRVQGERRTAAMDKLKPLITNDEIEIVRKGFDGKQVANVTNYIACTNHMDALALDEGDRRWGVMKTRFETREAMLAEQSQDDWNNYWNMLHEAIDCHPGVIRSWLLNVDLSDFNRVVGPEMNAAKHAMIDASRTGADADIREAIALGGEGVGTKAVATDCLNARIKEMGGKSIHTSTISNILRDSGWKKCDLAVKWRDKTRRVYYRPDAVAGGLTGSALVQTLKALLDDTLSDIPQSNLLDEDVKW